MAGVEKSHGCVGIHWPAPWPATAKAKGIPIMKGKAMPADAFVSAL